MQRQGLRFGSQLDKERYNVNKEDREFLECFEEGKRSYWRTSRPSHTMVTLRVLLTFPQIRPKGAQIREIHLLRLRIPRRLLLLRFPYRADATQVGEMSLTIPPTPSIPLVVLHGHEHSNDGPPE
jgi:hypothetical protein